jgi:hypothetical protein
MATKYFFVNKALHRASQRLHRASQREKIISSVYLCVFSAFSVFLNFHYRWRANAHDDSNEDSNEIDDSTQCTLGGHYNEYPGRITPGV